MIAFNGINCARILGDKYILVFGKYVFRCLFQPTVASIGTNEANVGILECLTSHTCEM